MIDSDWVPHDTSSSLYIRPTMIGMEPSLGVAPADAARLFVLLCPVGPYFAAGFKPVNLLCDPSYVRAWPGGCGFTKMGSNYAPTLWTQKVCIFLCIFFFIFFRFNPFFLNSLSQFFGSYEKIRKLIIPFWLAVVSPNGMKLCPHTLDTKGLI